MSKIYELWPLAFITGTSRERENTKHTIGTILPITQTNLPTTKVTFHIRTINHTRARQHWDISVVILYPPNTHTHTLLYLCLHEDLSLSPLISNWILDSLRPAKMSSREPHTHTHTQLSCQWNWPLWFLETFSFPWVRDWRKKRRSPQPEWTQRGRFGSNAARSGGMHRWSFRHVQKKINNIHRRYLLRPHTKTNMHPGPWTEAVIDEWSHV